MRVLLAEDDPALGRVVAQGLRESTYAVDVASDGDSALRLAALNAYDAIVLDVLMPKRSGLEVCRAIRARGSRTPILLLTARDAVDDRIGGLDAGADDYLTKPFAFGELLARLRALLRRVPGILPQVLAVGDLRIDTGSHRVERAGRPIELTNKEYALLEYLARNAGRVVGRADICEHVWDDNHDPFSNAIEVYVNRLRGKVDGPTRVPLIHTRRGAGYMLAELDAR
ncbi:MAG: response regulator transcription factor [Gemmatimonadota bacterium]|nr:response regulator transcription factor [Gemmatimonadota bacterium]